MSQTTESQMINIRPYAESLIKTVLLLDRAYGFSYLVNLVRGDADFLKQPGHQQIETFGSMSEESFGLIQDVGWYLIRAGYLTVANKLYGTLSVTMKGEEFLQETAPLMVEKEEFRMQWYHLVLSGELRELRRQEANLQQKEPYEVFTNFVLMQIVRNMPADEGAFQRIYGAEKMSSDLQGKILDRISEISREMARDEELYGAIAKAHSPGHKKIREMFEAGIEVDEIARRQNLKVNTVYNYLENLHLARMIDLKPWIENHLDNKTLHRGTDYFKQARTSRLTDAHDVLGLDYSTLRLCRLYASKPEPVS